MRAHLAVLLGAALAVSGCKAVNSPLPAGAVDIVDATANEVLQPAHAFALTISNAVLSTDPAVHITLTPAQTDVLVALNKSINIADALEIAYHSKPTTTAATQLKLATTTVQTNLASAQTIITVTPGK